MTIQTIDTSAGLKNYFVEVAQGNVSGVTAIRKFGRNLDLDNGVEEDIWGAGGTRAWLSSAETMDIVSTDAADDGDPAGTGLHEVTVYGLDSNFLDVNETITLNGTSAVTTTQSFIRVYRMKGGAAGSGTVNAGDITCDPTSSGSGSRQAFIEAGDGQSQITHYTVPANKIGYLITAQASIFAVAGASTRSARVKLLTRETSSNTWRDIDEIGLALHGSSVSPSLNFEVPEHFPEKSDIRFTGLADVNNTGVYVRYTLLLVNA